MAYSELRTVVYDAARMESARVREGELSELADRLESLVERYGADQWSRGNAGKEPEEFEEWRKRVEA